MKRVAGLFVAFALVLGLDQGCSPSASAAQAVESGWDGLRSGPIAKQMPVAVEPGTKPKKAQTSQNLLVGPYHWYEVGTDFTNSNVPVPSGVGMNASVHSPAIDFAHGDHFSLAQIAITENTGSADQIVEFGWAKYPLVFGDNNPHLFASKWENGAWCGSWTGSGSCGGALVDIAGGVNIGDSLAGVVGTSKQFIVTYRATGGCGGAGAAGWYLRYNGTDIACFPKTGAGWPSNFDQARTVQVFGEVVTVDDPNVGCTDMSSSTHGGATIGSVTYYDASGSGLPTTDVVLAVTETPANTGWTETALSTRTFSYGGPGAC